MKKTPLTVILILASSLCFSRATQVARAEPAPGSLIGYTELRTSLSEATELCDDTLHAWKIFGQAMKLLHRYFATRALS